MTEDTGRLCPQLSIEATPENKKPPTIDELRAQLRELDRRITALEARNDARTS